MTRRLPLLLALCLLAACGSANAAASGDHKACGLFALWVKDGGNGANYGGYVSLLNEAESAALKATTPQAREAIQAGHYRVPGGAPGILARDISFVQTDATVEVSPPAGFGDEVAAVQTDCAGL